jgi:hypothetical protein
MRDELQTTTAEERQKSQEQAGKSGNRKNR